MSHIAEFMRKTPTQKRSHQTMSDIFEATAQLLDAEAAAGFNTNRIAERAGFSIGTVYSYFPNKASLLRAMALHELERCEARFVEQIAASSASDPASLIRAVVRQALMPFPGRQRVRRRLVLLVGQDPVVQSALHQAIDRMTRHFLMASGIAPDEVSAARRFLLLRSLIGPVRAAATHAPDLLSEPAFEEELTQMLLAQLHALRGLQSGRSQRPAEASS